MKRNLSILLSMLMLLSLAIPASAAESVSLDAAMRYEFEDYTTTHISTAEPNASGTAIVGNTYAQNLCADISIPVSVSESGYYDVEYVVSDATTNQTYISTIEFYLDGTLLGNNLESYTEGMSDTYPNFWTATAVGKVVKKATWIEAGDYTLTATIHNTAGEAGQGKIVYKYMMDYIAFTPTESFVALELGTVDSVIAYDEAVSGTALLALYNNNELVTVKTADLNSQKQTAFSFPVAADVTHAKSFLWKDLIDVMPLKNDVFHEIARALYTVEAEERFTIDSDTVADGDLVLDVTNSPDSPIRQFTFLWQFGETMIASWSQHTDTYENAPYDAIMISRDGGITWGEKQVKQNFYLTSVCQLADGTLLGVNYWTHYIDTKTATVHYWTSDDMGATWTEHAGTIHHEQDITSNSGGWASIVMHRGMRQLPDGTLQGMAYGSYVGDKTNRCVVVESEDGGANWYVTATVASGAPKKQDGTEETTGIEGFCEPVMTECADGSLLCVMRIGSQKPLYQSRSYDGGATWSTPEILPGIDTLPEAYSVDPDLCLMSNGVLVLTTGRPSAKLLVSLDGSGYLWQEKPTQLYTGSTGYTGVREVAPNRVLVIGDLGTGHKVGGTYGIWGRFVDIERRTSYAPYLDRAHLSYDRKIMSLGETQQLKLSAFDNDGRKLTEGLDITFDSSDTDVASVDTSGVLTANSDGTVALSATITANGKTVVSNEITVQIADINKLETVSAAAASQSVALEQTMQITAKPLNLYGDEIEDNTIVTTYTSSDDAIASVDESGLVTGVAGGTATITVTMTQGTTVKSATVTIVVFGGTGNTYAFDSDTTGEPPAGLGYHPNATSVTVSEAQAASGTKSVYLNDTATNSMTCLRVNDATSSNVRVVDFKFFPESISTGVCLKFYRDNEYVQSQFAFNLSFSASGTVSCYINGAWSSMLPEGTIKIGEWNTVRVITNASAKTVTVTANDETAVASGVNTAAYTRGVEFHSGSTYTAGCSFYLDDITVSRNLNILQNGGFELGTEGWSGKNATLISSTSEKCTGSAAVKVEKTGIYGYVGQTVAVTPGATYNATAWVKLGEGSNQNVYIAAVHQENGQDVYTTLKMASVAPGSWTELTGSITIPEDISEIELYVQLFANDNSTGALTQDFYVDDVVLEPAS